MRVRTRQDRPLSNKGGGIQPGERPNDWGGLLGVLCSIQYPVTTGDARRNV
jgi:hypothetical protein